MLILYSSQKIIATDKHLFRVVRCGRRFGKTCLAAVEMIGYATAYDNVRVPYYAPTRDDARDIMWGILNREAEEIIVNKNESRLELTVNNKFGGTSLMALYGWEAVKERKKGIGVANKFIVLDEVSKYRGFWEGWEEVLRPTLTDLRGDALFLSTPNGYNFFYDLCNKELKDKDFKSFHFTSYDNPYLPRDELESAKQSLPPGRFLQEYMAGFQKTQGLVYKEFDRKKHLYDNLPDLSFKRIAGIDFGFRNPAAVLDIRTNGEKFFVEDEWYKTKRTDMQLAEYVSACGFLAVYPDPESPQAIEELRRKNVNVREVIKSK